MIAVGWRSGSRRGCACRLACVVVVGGVVDDLGAADGVAHAGLRGAVRPFDELVVAVAIVVLRLIMFNFVRLP